MPDLFYFPSLCLEKQSQSKATLFIINEGGGLSADVNKEALVDVATGTECAHPAKPGQFTACPLIAMDWSEDYRMGCLFLSAQLAHTGYHCVVWAHLKLP